MKSKEKIIACPYCGNYDQSFLTINDGVIHCICCNTFSNFEKTEEVYKKLNNKLDEAEMIKHYKAINNLYNAINEQYPSKKDILLYLHKVKENEPDNILANLFEIIINHSIRLSKFLKEIINDITENEKELIANQIIKNLESRDFTAINVFIDSIKDQYVKQKLFTLLENEIEKIEHGTYNLDIQRDIFIAHSSKDAILALELLERLEESGFECFISSRNLRHGIHASEEYATSIKTAIKNCTYFLLVNTINSRNVNCDVLRVEIPIVNELDRNHAPLEYKNEKPNRIPIKYRKKRINYFIDNYRKHEDGELIVTDKFVKEFFDGYEQCASIAKVENIIMNYKMDIPVIEEPIKKEDLNNKNNLDNKDNIEKLLIKAEMKIEEGKFDDASNILDQVEDLDIKNADLWQYRLLIEAKAYDLSSLAKQSMDYSESLMYQRAIRFADEKKKNLIIKAVNEAREKTVIKEKIKPKNLIEEKAKPVSKEEKLALQGDKEAQYKIGKAYYDGSGVPKDFKKAVYWFQKAAEQNQINAQNWLGYCYEYGEGVTKDYKQAAYWYQKAANQGYDVAQNNLGICYYHGTGIVKDYKQAVYWFEKSAKQGYDNAQNWLGVCYENGEGVTKDYKQAIYWYQKSADQGYDIAQCNLGYCYESGIGVAVDYKQAIYWYQKSANQGYARAQCNLGYCYDIGIGIPKDYKQAIYWYQKAADQGYNVAQNNLGVCYENGIGVIKDNKQAAYWYQTAANQGYDIAQCNLGYCYESGIGVAVDNKQAIYWYQKAADQGYARAQCNLGYCYDIGIGVIKDNKQAVYWYQKAADQGYDMAQNNLGVCYENGYGVPKDYKQAIQWYQKAANQGNKNAKSNLAKLKNYI